MLDNNTFGDSPAAINLAKIINERNFNSKRISKILINFNKTIMDLNGVNVTTAIMIMELVYANSFIKCETLPEPFNTYTQNVLSTKYKQWQKRKNTHLPKKKRIT